jgi:hypothetical protein
LVLRVLQLGTPSTPAWYSEYSSLVLRVLKLGIPRTHSQVSEVLVLSGEVHPASPHRRAWHAMLVAVCAAALDRGFLPHTNAGRSAGQATLG